LDDGGGFGVESAADAGGAVGVGDEGQFAAGYRLLFVQEGAVGVEVGADAVGEFRQVL